MNKLFVSEAAVFLTLLSTKINEKLMQLINNATFVSSYKELSEALIALVLACEESYIESKENDICQTGCNLMAKEQEVSDSKTQKCMFMMVLS